MNAEGTFDDFTFEDVARAIKVTTFMQYFVATTLVLMIFDART